MKRLIKLSLVAVAAVMTMTSCNCYKKMAKNASDVSVLCTPEVLALVNDEVPAEITIDIPANYFNKKAVVRVTPVLVYQGGEVTAEPFFLQGTKVEDNYTVVNFGTGAQYTQKVSFKYSDMMRRSKLQVRLEVYCGCKECDEYVLLNPTTGAPITMTQMEVIAANPTSDEALIILRECGISVADGVNTLQGDINYGALIAPMKDDYKRVTTTVEKADIKYAMSSSVVRSTALKSECVDGFEQVVADTKGNDRATQTIFANGYASPDGPEGFNDKLSKARSESARKAMSRILADYGINIDVAAYGEDWDGFKELVEKSDIADKNLILQVLSLHDSSSQREAEIRNLSSVFGELKSDVLPQLRRTQMTNRIDLQGKTDEEMLALVNSKSYSELTLEEIMFICANLKVAPVKKVELMEYAAKKYDDARAYNNLGVQYVHTKQYEKALAAFEKAVAKGAKGQQINKNMALANLALRDADEASKYVNGADAPTKSVATAVKDGNYTDMSKQTRGLNASIAYTQMGNYSAAKSALGQDMSGGAEYMRAVIASLEGDIKTSGDKLSSAIKKNKIFADKAETDVNLKNLFDSGYQLND